ncbi:MAG: hypothetical protein K6G12_04820 [Lachnospiraceae bacterium]|nr:hypothetical protein [Lachnospiraceae bacterium]
MKTGDRDQCGKDAYWTYRPDTRKMAILFVRNLWKVIIGMAAGAVVCALGYFAYHAIFDGTIYSGYSRFYIDFTIDEDGNAAYDYYNGYTWNDLMTTDLIAGYTLDNVQDKSIDIVKLEEDTRADILSDIRVLKVTFTDSDEAVCADIQQATEKAVVSLGEDAKEFDKISLIKSVAPSRVYTDDRIKQAILLGLLAGLIISLIVMRFKYILDDTIMLPSDIRDMGIKLLGVNLKEEDPELAKKLNSLINTESTGAEDKDGKEPVTIEIPYKGMTRSALRYELDRYEENGVPVKGAYINGADNAFYKIYYYGSKTADK